MFYKATRAGRSEVGMGGGIILAYTCCSGGDKTGAGSFCVQFLQRFGNLIRDPHLKIAVKTITIIMYSMILTISGRWPRISINVSESLSFIDSIEEFDSVRLLLISARGSKGSPRSIFTRTFSSSEKLRLLVNSIVSVR